jgi:glycosyltransferase involved in cell wall biosynthesis
MALHEIGIEVRVIAPAARDLAPREELNGIHVERFRYAPRSMETLAYTGNMAQDVAGSFSAKLALTSFVGSELLRAAWERKAFRPDVIHAHWWFPSGVVGMSLAALSTKPLVTTLHGTDLRMAKKVKASQVLFRSVMKRSSAVTTVSKWLAAEAVSLVGDLNVDVAPMPVATEKFEPRGNHHDNRFLFAGRLNEQKGLDHLLRAFAGMRRVAMLDVVGEGHKETELKLLASQLGISDRVVWHGQLEQPDLVKMYQAATAVVVPSVDEGLGLVAAEALLCETPVIAFRSGGLTDVIEHGVTGFLVTPGETHELGAALDNVLDAPDSAAETAREGRQVTLERFSPENAAARYRDIYLKALAKRAP